MIALPVNNFYTSLWNCDCYEKKCFNPWDLWSDILMENFSEDKFHVIVIEIVVKKW